MRIVAANVTLANDINDNDYDTDDVAAFQAILDENPLVSGDVKRTTRPAGRAVMWDESTEKD